MTAGSNYTDQQRREAVAHYVLLGNLTAVAKVTSIPATTLSDWARSTWWNTLVVEVRAEKGAELDGAFTRILHATTEQLLDRLKHGGPYIVGGEVRRKPVAARDLAIVAGVVHDKRVLARNESPTPRRDDNYLPGLAAYLENYAREKATRQKQGGGEQSLRGE